MASGGRVQAAPSGATETPDDLDCSRAIRLIAQGWEVIESDGAQITIQAPGIWDEEGPRKLIVDTDVLPPCTR